MSAEKVGSLEAHAADALQAKVCQDCRFGIAVTYMGNPHGAVAVAGFLTQVHHVACPAISWLIPGSISSWAFSNPSQICDQPSELS
jgi:hypothetical protein